MNKNKIKREKQDKNKYQVKKEENKELDHLFFFCK